MALSLTSLGAHGCMAAILEAEAMQKVNKFEPVYLRKYQHR